MMATSITAFAAKPEDAVAPKGVVTIEDSGERDGELALYYATIDLSDVGTLTHEKISATKFAGNKVVQYTLEFKGDDLLFLEIADATLGATAFGSTADATEDSPAGFNGIQVAYANTTAKTAYPTASDDSGVIEAACVMAFYGIPGNKVTLGASQIGYATYGQDGKMSGAVERLDVTYDVAEFTLPGGEPEPAADVVVNSGKKYDNGYAWNVTVNKEMETFGVKFYSGEETLEKSVKNVEDLPKLDGGVGYNFNVGLKTAKTIDKADFTADDATATWNK
jgi:hypothetical protein